LSEIGFGTISEINHSLTNIFNIIMALNIKPIADRVVIEPSAAETTTASGIIIPDTAKEKPQKGTVVAVGTGKTDYTMTVKIGDTVLYGKYAGTELKYEGKDYLIMREDEIYAIL
jgi:chaperonin GroES